jgi:hypothetical protein
VADTLVTCKKSEVINRITRKLQSPKSRSRKVNIPVQSIEYDDDDAGESVLQKKIDFEQKVPILDLYTSIETPMITNVTVVKF